MSLRIYLHYPTTGANSVVRKLKYKKIKIIQNEFCVNKQRCKCQKLTNNIGCLNIYIIIHTKIALAF